MRRVKTAWAMIRGVIDSLLVQCISNPFLTHSGGSAIPRRIGAVTRRPHGKIRRPSCLLILRMPVYEQKIFFGAPDVKPVHWGGVYLSSAGDFKNVQNCMAKSG